MSFVIPLHLATLLQVLMFCMVIDIIRFTPLMTSQLLVLFVPFVCLLLWSLSNFLYLFPVISKSSSFFLIKFSLYLHLVWCVSHNNKIVLAVGACVSWWWCVYYHSLFLELSCLCLVCNFQVLVSARLWWTMLKNCHVQMLLVCFD